jgi:hypothetical protein
LGAKKAFNGVKTGVDALIGANIKFGEQSKEVTDQLSKYKEMLSGVAVAGKASTQGAKDITGSEVLGGKVKSMSGGRASEGVSSLQRIGGGGGAFGGYNPQKSAEEQKAETQRTNELLYQQNQILKNPRTGEYVIPKPTMSILI